MFFISIEPLGNQNLKHSFPHKTKQTNADPILKASIICVTVRDLPRAIAPSAKDIAWAWCPVLYSHFLFVTVISETHSSQQGNPDYVAIRAVPQVATDP